MQDKLKLRSHEWFGNRDILGFTHRSWIKNQGHPDQMFDGRPVIGICNTWSDLTPCNAHFRILAEFVKRGVYEAGGYPLEFPVMSLGEVLMRPTTMLFRNLASMDVEETIRANPLDGVVLLTGCDKTTPATVMGACSVDIPTIVLPGGPMLNGKYNGRDIGSGTDVWRFTDELRAGNLTMAEYLEAESCMSRSDGHCMTMGTASTMTSSAEALGLTLPGAASIPAPDSRHAAMATLTGKRIVEMVWEDLKPSDILTDASFRNAVTTVLALGGSTNAIVHLLAMARRAGIKLDLDAFDRLAREVPLLANLRPSGKYLMEDFYYAGGLRALLNSLGDRLERGARTVSGRTLDEDLAGARVFNDDVIRTTDKALVAFDSLAVLRGNLAPDGAVIKPPAAEPRLHRHSGKAVVFADYNDMAARIDAPDLPVDANSVLVLKHAGPLGGPGMPEWGQLPIPKKLLQQGVRDMVRISDARMSGTSYGACVLHVAPESWIGGPLALVRDGDVIELDVPGRKLTLKVSEEELARRRAAWKPPTPRYERGYGAMFARHITQANEGCDFDFLERGAPTGEPEIH
jgi:dihydroxy-acid dehydratase